MKRMSHLNMSRLTLATSYFCCAALAFAQSPPPGDCVVNILNRTSLVAADGLWRIDNVPTGQGPVRARFTCTTNGVTQYGQSPFINLLAGRTTAFPPGITLGNYLRDSCANRRSW